MWNGGGSGGVYSWASVAREPDARPQYYSSADHTGYTATSEKSKWRSPGEDVRPSENEFGFTVFISADQPP